MKKKIILSIMLLVMVIVACVALVGCNNKCTCTNCNGISNTETRTAHIKYVYVLTTQFMSGDTFTMGSLLIKPENPTYINNVFNAGYGMTEQGYIGEFDLPMNNPRMGEGFDANKNYRFIAWYTEPEYLYQWNFNEDRIWRDITLYAKWVEL